MQMHNACSTVSSPLRTRQHHHHPRALTVSRFRKEQAASSSSTAQSMPTRSQPQTGGGVKLPAPQEMQASVMLVPKDKPSSIMKATAASPDSPLNGFLVKCRLAWNLFFPPEANASTRKLSPKDLGKQRLSMILVADRCGLSPNSLVEMKRSTLAALQDCMELEDLQDAHLRFTMTRENGVTYSMAVPILRPDASTDEDETAAYASDVEYEGGYDEFEGVAYSAADGSIEEEQLGGAGERNTWAANEQQMAAVGGGSSGSSAAADALAALADAQTAAVAALEASVAAAVGASGSAAVLPAGWRSKRASSRAGGSPSSSRGGSPTTGAQDTAAAPPPAAAAGLTPNMLKDLLVEELVHDVEGLVLEQGQQQQQQGVDVGGDAPQAAATGGAAALVAVDVLAEQLEAAVAEVQHFGEVGASSSSSSSSTEPEATGGADGGQVGGRA